jgi:hypothetical protein
MLLYLWTRLRVSFDAYIQSLCFSSDSPGVNPATNDRMILYYCLMTKVDRLADSTVFSWAGCHTSSKERCVCEDGLALAHLGGEGSLGGEGRSGRRGRADVFSRLKKGAQRQ